MTKPTIVVNKIGAVLWTQAAKKRSSAVGEQGETEGIVRHLVDRGDLNVVYLGQINGEIEGVISEQPNVKGLDELSKPEEQEAVCKDLVERVRKYDPKLIITINGYPSTFSWIGNPKGVFVQACGVKYTAPTLYTIHALKLPRVCINNDPRMYPREQEMALMWPEVIPCAQLGQITASWSKIVGGKRFEVREVYAGAENWCFRPYRESEKDLLCTIVAHAHIKDGVKSPGRDPVWSTILSPESDYNRLKMRGMRIYGKGWEHFAGYDPECMLGCVNPDEVDDILARSKCGPIVATKHGFYTGKLRTYLNQRCAPILWGRGEEFTYDLNQLFLPYESPFRIQKPGDLLKVVDVLSNDSLRDEYIDNLLALTRADWTLLDQCIDDIIVGINPRSEAFFQKYGGYREQA